MPCCKTQAVVPLQGLERDFSKSEWVRLRPRAKDLEGLDEGNGSLRLALRVWLCGMCLDCPSPLARGTTHVPVDTAEH